MRRLAFLAASSFVVFALAGCSGSTTTQTNAASGTAATHPPLAVDKGAISGLVIDDVYRPVPGALVLLTPAGLTTTSDGEGQFTFTDLDPGSYLLQVQAKGHEAAPTTADVKAGAYTDAELLARRVFSDAGTIVTTEYSIFIDCSEEAVVITQSGSLEPGLPNCTADFSGDSSRAYYQQTLAPQDANATTYFVTESLANQQIPYMLSIGLFNPTEALENATFAQQNVEQGLYGRVQMEPNQADVRDHEHDQANNSKWNAHEPFYTFLYPHGMFFDQLQNAPCPAPSAPPPAKGVICGGQGGNTTGLWGAGVVLGFKGKIVQSLFLGKPTVDVEKYGVLRPSA